jgi:molecular chaperone HscA
LRALREQQVEAERLLEALSNALVADGEALLSADEFATLSAALDQLRMVHNPTAADAIRHEIERISALSDSFAAKRMDHNIKRALSGHHLNDFEK